MINKPVKYEITFVQDGHLCGCIVSSVKAVKAWINRYGESIEHCIIKDIEGKYEMLEMTPNFQHTVQQLLKNFPPDE